MISAKSFFNKGIYKSTVKRFAWGSILYFVLLFLVTSMSILSFYDPSDYANSRSSYNSFLLGSYTVVPLLLTMVVPTIAGIMIFRFIHSKKASVFIHSLPVKRTAIYISSVLAGFTLMLVPVIANGLVLMLLSVTKYSQFFSVSECMIWILINSLSLLAMFSCTCFVAVLTGNSFAMCVLNLLFHTILMIISGCFVSLAEVFLYGYPENMRMSVMFAETTFPSYIFEVCGYFSQTGKHEGNIVPTVCILLAVTIILYVFALILYKKRKMENAEDIAGFKVLSYVFKYVVTLMGALITFSAFSSLIYVSQPMTWGIVATLSALVYFGTEMLLKKSFLVWRSYKGFIGFLIIFAFFVLVLAHTSFFGFETRIPDKNAISEAAIYTYMYEDYMPSEKDEIKEAIIDAHTYLINCKAPLLNTSDRLPDTRFIHIEYKLKNGKTFTRSYGMTEKQFYKMQNALYSSDSYKEALEFILKLDDNLRYVAFDGEAGEITDKEILKELTENLKKDIYSLSYEEIYKEEKTVVAVFGYYVDGIGSTESYFSINRNFKNTIQYLKEKFVKFENLTNTTKV